MNKKRVHIDSLHIKLPRSMRGQAHSIASAIGNDVATNVGNAAGGGTGRIKVDEISIGRVQDISVVGAKAASKVGELLKDRSRK